MHPSLLHLASTVISAADRLMPARALAEHLGGHALLFLLRDEATHAFVPAPGFPKALLGGPAWEEQLARMGPPGGVVRGSAHFPDEPAEHPVLLLRATERLVVALSRPEPKAEEQLAGLVPLASLLESTFSTEQRAEELQARAALASAAVERTRRQLQESIDGLKDRDRKRDQFLAMLAHELRNPLAPLLTALQLLERRGHVRPESERMLTVATRQAHHLARLVNDLLDVARITHGRLELRREHADARCVVLRAVEALSQTAESRRIALRVEASGEAAPVQADVVRLEQIITNIVSNAIKYTAAGGRIDVSMRVERPWFVMRVADTGVGISPELLPHVFEPFVQADTSLDRSLGGLGLGLSIASGLVRLHGGDIFAESRGLGHGSTFEVRLPLDESRSADERPAVEDSAAPVSRRILVVDDNADAAEALAEGLRAGGHDVRVADDGARAILEAESFRPEVVILDIGLPGMNGYEVAARLRAMPATGQSRIFALTGYGRTEDRERSRAAGFTNHFVKPVDLRELERAVADV